MSRRQWRCFPLLPFLLGAGCSTSSEFGLVLDPGTTADLQVLGYNPFVQVDNDGPGHVLVTFAPGIGLPDQVLVVRGSIARTLRGGGQLQFAVVVGDRANLRVRVQGSSGADLRTRGRQP